MISSISVTPLLSFNLFTPADIDTNLRDWPS
jgi:hypothetical protein